MTAEWRWGEQSKDYGNYGNANQWAVNAGLASLARESTQNSNDARIDGEVGDLTFTFIQLTRERRDAFLQALRWHDDLAPHLDAMGASAGGAVAAGQIQAGLEAMRDASALVLLRVSDSGCRGLTGGEFPEAGVEPEDYGNFIKLCRLDLFSGKDSAAGGSFGLGKAVYWRFSRVQTVLFHSVPAEDAAPGRARLFGVSQGVLHDLDGRRHVGRGYFGVPDHQGHPMSVWDDTALAEALHLGREDDRPGTSALLIGFYDPDRPELGTGSVQELTGMAQELRENVEENFWPLLARNGMRVRVQVVKDGVTLQDEQIDPGETFGPLVDALRRFDEGAVDDDMVDENSVVVRDVPITVSRRRTGDQHDAFLHQAKLVVTASDGSDDNLVNKVCLFRKPEMIVETVDQSFDGRTYHAFLLAGSAINPSAPTDDERRADEFLRFAEPPSHDRWIHRGGRQQVSQANLTAHYVAPWVPNLRNIDGAVREALQGLFGDPPPPPDKAPEAIFKFLKFLHTPSGTGHGTGTAPRRPAVEIIEADVAEGRWRVRFQVRAKNRPEGWRLHPQLTFVGLDGAHTKVAWEMAPQVVHKANEGPRVEDGDLILPSQKSGRTLKAVLEATSTDNLPIPAEEAGIEIVLRVVDDNSVTARSNG